MKLREIIAHAEEHKRAIGHFNFSNLEGFWAIVGACREFSEESGGPVPVFVATSEGEADFVGRKEAVALVKAAREELNLPIFLNADHHHSFEAFKEAVDAGYDSAIIDGAKLSLPKNIELVKKAVLYARENNPGMLVEGELGYIGTSSKILDEVPEGAQITEEMLAKPEEAERFVKETDVDLLAPAVGNLHGMLKNAANPRLNIERVKEIRKAAGVPLVLHGGSGVSDEDFRSAIEAGMPIVHINTEIRLAYRQGLENSLENNPDEIAPYKYLAPAREAVKEAVKERMKLFANF